MRITWPQIVRALGLGAAIYGLSPLSASQDKASILVFAGSLILAPQISRAQERRNNGRNGSA